MNDWVSKKKRCKAVEEEGRKWCVFFFQRFFLEFPRVFVFFLEFPFQGFVVVFFSQFLFFLMVFLEFLRLFDGFSRVSRAF